MKTTYKNLTKNTVQVVINGRIVTEFPPSGEVAECVPNLKFYAMLACPDEGPLGQVPAYYEEPHPAVKDLPPQVEDVILIVTRDVFDATSQDNGLAERLDVITPRLVLGNAAVCDGFICH